MKTIKVITGIAALLLLSSCMNSFLDVKPTGKLIPEKASDFENLMNYDATVEFQFMDNNRGTELAFLTDNYQITEALSAGRFGPGSVNMNRYAAYIYYEPVSNPKEADTEWESFYKAISYFNTVIDGIGALSDEEKSSSEGKTLVAQAKAARGWAYMNATFVWGPGYDPNGANDSKVMPYRTSGSPTIANEGLKTTSEMLAAAKQDLEDALTDAPDLVGTPSRASKNSIKAILAQYYMYTRDWDNMLKYSEDVWKSALATAGGDPGNLIYNLNDFQYIEKTVAPAPGEDAEVYKDLGYFPDGILNTDEHFNRSSSRENLFFRVGTSSSGEDYIASEDFKSIFDPSTDRRYQLFMLNVTSNGEIVKSYYRADKIGNANNVAITYPEVLLMCAEANARKGNLTVALSDLNILRKYRYTGTDTDLANGSSLTQDQLLNEILTERRRELPIGTISRLLDLKRFQFDSGKPWCKTVIEHKIGSQTYSAKVSDAVFNKPIDNVILSYNPDWGVAADTRTWAPK
jgi:hypothetical protein